MLGWFTEEMARASRKKRCNVTGSLVQDSERNFRGDVAPELGVLGLVDDPHPPRAEGFEHFVVSDSSTLHRAFRLPKPDATGRKEDADATRFWTTTSRGLGARLTFAEEGGQGDADIVAIPWFQDHPLTATSRSECDGVTLMSRWWERDAATAQVLIVHGLAEHIGRYEHVAASLTARAASPAPGSTAEATVAAGAAAAT